MVISSGTEAGDIGVLFGVLLAVDMTDPGFGSLGRIGASAVGVAKLEVW